MKNQAQFNCWHRQRLSPPFYAQTDCGTHPLSYQTSIVAIASMTNFLMHSPHSNIEVQNVWSFTVTGAHRYFTVYHIPVTEPVKEAIKCMNTTHKNVIMCYLELIFLDFATVIPLILPLTFQHFSRSQFLRWWWKIDLLMSSSCATVYLSFHLLKNCWKFN
jgi:hypothetical protein